MDLGTTTTIVAANVHGGSGRVDDVLGERVTDGGLAVPAPLADSWRRISGDAEVLGRLEVVDWLPDEFRRERGLDLRTDDRALTRLYDAAAQSRTPEGAMEAVVVLALFS